MGQAGQQHHGGKKRKSLEAVGMGGHGPRLSSLEFGHAFARARIVITAAAFGESSESEAMTDSDSDEFDLPPMISLEDLVGPSNAEVVATTRVIFPRCDATPAELAAVESHLRRCLAYPVIAYAPAFEGRCELLLAILEELRRNDSNTGVDPAPPEPLGEEAPEENFAGRVALADLEASLSECRDQERFSRIGGSRSALAASLRWRRRAAALEALRKPLRERLGIKDLPPKAAPTRQLALKSASTAAAHTGGAQSFSVLRSLSFERKKKEAVVSSDGGSGRGASGGGEDGGGGKSFSILRSLSFERKKKEADAAGTSKQSKQKQAMLRAAAAKGGGAAGADGAVLYTPNARGGKGQARGAGSGKGGGRGSGRGKGRGQGT
jgi:hypothetical protein